MRTLFEHCCSLEVADGWPTPLIYAARQGREDVIQLLLDAGADPDGHDREGETPLLAAVMSGMYACARNLLINGAKVDTESRSGKTALWWAVYGKHEALVSLLLSYGASARRRGPNDQLILSLAASRGDAIIMRYLLDSGAKEGGKDANGRGPIIWTGECGYDGVV
jgi:ankyrin repeat protein